MKEEVVIKEVFNFLARFCANVTLSVISCNYYTGHSE